MPQLQKRGFAIVFLMLSGALVSCSNNTGQNEKKGGKVEWIDPNSIQPGPIRHEKLSDEQMERIRSLQVTFGEVDGQSLEKWVDDFKRDLNPDRELRIWEQMAKAYRAYCEKRELSLEEKKDVFGVVLMRSMASEQEVLEKVKLKRLSKDEAKQVLQGF